MGILDKIERLKEEVEALRPIPADLEAKIMQKFRLDWNYHSNSIEGNRLTFGETKTFLLHGITADGKPLKDHLDIRGHNDALLLLEDIIHDGRPITENFIRELHKMILQEDYYNTAITPTGERTKRLIKIGQYKQAPNHVKTATGEIFHFASPEETPAEMDGLIQWLREKSMTESPVALAALFHYKFIRIHPFDDGNGRLARILMNLLLMRAGYPPVVIKVEQKDAYYIALQKADGGDVPAFFNYVATELLTSLELYLKGAKGENIEELDDADKEFELLKMTLEGKDENLLLQKDTAPEIYENIVFLLFNKVINKLFKCNDFYNQRDFSFRLSEPDKHYGRVTFEDKKEFIIVLNRFKGRVEQRNKFELVLKWYDFKKTEHRLHDFNYSITFSVIFSDIFCLFFINEDKHHTSKIYYHKNIELQATEIANKLLTDFMEHIKKNLNT